MCLAFAAMHAVEAGYNVYGVIDASGGVEVTIRENAVARMKDHGSPPSTGPRLLPSSNGTGGCRPGKTWGGCSTTTITTTALQWTASTTRARMCARRHLSCFVPVPDACAPDLHSRRLGARLSSAELACNVCFWHKADIASAGRRTTDPCCC